MSDTRNPPLTRDEFILVLDLYFRVNPRETTAKDQRIQELSKILNSLPFHPINLRKDTFRNPTGVYMLMSGFLRWDPTYPGTGLRGGKLGKEVWDEFANDRTRLTRTAEGIRSAAVLLVASGDVLEERDDEEFPEGRILSRLHRLRERNPSLVKRKKGSVLREKGCLACEACGFDFYRLYGRLGLGFAECHHRKPLSELPKLRNSTIADLAIVCANCHRILHRARPWMSVEELKRHLSPC